MNAKQPYIRQTNNALFDFISSVCINKAVPSGNGYSTANLLSSRNLKLETYIEGATIT